MRDLFCFFLFICPLAPNKQIFPTRIGRNLMWLGNDIADKSFAYFFSIDDKSIVCPNLRCHQVNEFSKRDWLETLTHVVGVETHFLESKEAHTLAKTIPINWSLTNTVWLKAKLILIQVWSHFVIGSSWTREKQKVSWVEIWMWKKSVRFTNQVEQKVTWS